MKTSHVFFCWPGVTNIDMESYRGLIRSILGAIRQYMMIGIIKRDV